ncbi:MAG: imidazole glycerol phosphate synthase subunit HisH [Candidatus Omnitrophica bacterium]|nr:imidazole glycerol phosphate synthase subunit HisH [Candidatus Omnitrophota bacterium]
MNNNKATIVDYGMGNLFSIERAMAYIGGETEITGDPVKVRSAQRLILPGVGAFREGMRELKDRSLSDAICEFSGSGRPLLGICLGMQLLMSESDEFGLCNGLNLIKGRVRILEKPEKDNSFKIPHVGWREIYFKEGALNPGRSILRDVADGSHFYFVHSFICSPNEDNNIIAESEYGKDRFCSVLCKDNIWGCQFHPEKSARGGLKIFENFLKM